MTLQQLQYLVALAESNSINQAAQNLFVSQSGISKAIKQLESELGFPLLERSSRGITSNRCTSSPLLVSSTANSRPMKPPPTMAMA